MASQILQITSSLFGDNGNSTRLNRHFIDRFLAHRPNARIRHRELSPATVPHLDEATFAAFGTDADKRSETQRKLLRLSDAMIEELQQADLIVIGLPMYNFGVSSTIKAWFDHIGRAGVTFRYTNEGSEGLLKGKRAVITGARGGRYQGTGEDFQTPYVNKFLRFIGIEKIEWVVAEGLAMGDRAETSLREAEARLEQLAGRMAGELS